MDVVVPAGEAAEQELERLVEFAPIVADEDDLPWVALADPEGNELPPLQLHGVTSP